MSKLIFVSYRRADSEDFTLRLSEHLRSKIDADLFVDSQVIRGGRLNWQEQIGEALERCDALLVVVGSQWASIGQGGVRALERDDDWVRSEIRTALRRQIPIYVVRIGDAYVPARNELPNDIADLTSKQVADLRPARLAHDLALLLDWMARDGVVRLRSVTPRYSLRSYFPVAASLAIVSVAAVAFAVWRGRPPSEIVIASMLDDIDLSRSPYPPLSDSNAFVSRTFTVRLRPPPEGHWYVDISNTGGDGIECLGPSVPQDFVAVDAQETLSTSARAAYECRFTAAPASLREAAGRALRYTVVYRNAFRRDQDRWLVKRFAYATERYSLHLRFRADRGPTRVLISAGREGEPRRELGAYPVVGSEFTWSHGGFRQGEWVRIAYD